MKKITISILLLSFVFFVMVYACEFALGFIFEKYFLTSSPYKYRMIDDLKKQDVSFDPRTLWDYIIDVRKKGVEAYPSYITSHFTADDGLMVDGGKVFPLSGISNVHTVICNELGTYASYESDRYGFRNKDELWDQRVNIILLGDSYIHGECVNDSQTLSENLLNAGFKNLNLGIRGSSQFEQYAIFQEYVTDLKPKTVLWFFYESVDFARNYEGLESEILSKYLQKEFSQGLKDKVLNIDEALKDLFERQMEFYRQNTVYDVGSFIKLRRLRRLWYYASYNTFYNVSKLKSNPDELLLEIFKRANDKIESWGGELYFVYIPSWFRYALNDEVDLLENRRENMLDAISSLGIKTIDLVQYQDQHPDPLSLYPFRLHGHYNPDGYAFISEKIINVLKE